MLLTPHEQERLMISYAAELAWRRRGARPAAEPPGSGRGALLVRSRGGQGRPGVTELMQAGREVLTADDVPPGVAQLLPEVQVEATFPDGTKLVTIHGPIGPGTSTAPPSSAVRPGEVFPAAGSVTLSEGRSRTRLTVVNTGDRPIQVGSHFHFAQANEALSFDRTAAHGTHLDIPAGTAVRFEPGIEREVDLVPLAGTRVVAGLTLPAPGPLDGSATGDGTGSATTTQDGA